MRQIIRKKSSGFTLIEMIVVIIILGVLAAGISTFISLSTKIYTEVTDRDQLVSSARFAIERLNREVRNALPNSLIVMGKCLRFTPILESTIYTNIPVAPEGNSNTIDIIEFDETFGETSDINWSVVVYPLNPEDVYGSNSKVFGVNSISAPNDERVITLENSVQFAEDSPTQRLYFINGSVKYCIQNDTLLRSDSLNENILMAQDISVANSSFEVLAATLQRNGMVRTHFQFEKNSEIATFTNEIQVLNVP
jgi:MSHA biogenesis protein MshO